MVVLKPLGSAYEGAEPVWGQGCPEDIHNGHRLRPLLAANATQAHNDSLLSSSHMLMMGKWGNRSSLALQYPMHHGSFFPGVRWFTLYAPTNPSMKSQKGGKVSTKWAQ